MKRKIYNELLNWKNTNIQKPLMVIGARQIGKTYIINEFCKNDSSLLVSVGLDNRIPRGLIKYFVEVEYAMHLDDIMMRRLRFILTENDCGTLLAEHIAQEMGYILGWDSKKVEYEIKRYRTEIKRNRVSLY